MQGGDEFNGFAVSVATGNTAGRLRKAFSSAERREGRIQQLENLTQVQVTTLCSSS